MVTCALALCSIGLPVGSDVRRMDELSIGKNRFVRIEVRANEFTLSGQVAPSLDVDRNGRVAVAWESVRQLKGKPAAIYRVFDTDGTPLTPELRTSADETFAQQKPSVAWTQGRALTAFEALYRDQSAQGVFLGERQINVATRGSQWNVVAETLSGGNVLLVWSGEIGPDDSRIFARLVSSDGRPLGPEVRISDSPGGMDVNPTVAAFGDGAVIAWQRFGPNGSLKGIWAARVGADNDRVGPERKVAGDVALEPSLAATKDRLVLAWQQLEADGRHRVKFTVLAPDLTRRAGSYAPWQPGSQNGAAVALLPTGELALAWNLRKGNDMDVYLQTFDANARPTGKPFRVNRHTAGDQRLAEGSGKKRIACLPDGIVVAWSGAGDLGDSNGAHLTYLLSHDAQIADRVREVNARTERLLAANRPPHAVNVPLRAQVVWEAAQAHEPPTYDPRLREDPWGRASRTRGAGGFTGIVSTGWTPPDPALAVGPNQLVIMTNGAIAFFNKDGTKTFQSLIEGSNGFWGSLGATNFVFDPECLYDPLSGRFFVMAAEGNEPGNRSHVLMAVSDDSDPNGTWYKYRVETTQHAGNLFDSPNIAVDQNVVYVTGDGFGMGSNYPVYTFDKASMLAGQNIAVMKSTTMPTSTQSAGIPPVSFDNPPALYMIEHKESSSNTTVRLIALRNPLTSPTFTETTLTVPAYTSPPEDPPQQGSSSRPEAFDVRFWSVEYRNGSLWACHHVGTSRVLTRWYEIKMNGWPTSGQNPTLVQSGTIDPGSTIRTFFCSIGVDAAGNAAIICARSSPTEQFSMYRASRKATDALGTMPDQAILKSSIGPYTAGRWGDYSGCEFDPAQPGVFWGHHEWSENGAWRTWVESFAVVAPVTVNPDSFAITRGTHLSGGLSDLFNSDDLRVVAREAPPFTVQDPGVQLTITGVAPSQSLSSLQISVEAASSGLPTTSMRQRIEAFDYQANAWVIVDERQPSTGDQVVTVTLTNPNRFVQAATRKMSARVSYFDTGVIAPGWEGRYDRTVWIAQQ